MHKNIIADKREPKNERNPDFYLMFDEVAFKARIEFHCL